ncbi:MAG: hypothetical protein K9M13_00815 [Simkaniaceae bacterium]|nr:hypothetical protein [Simkaniaceae bacterium]
MKIGIGLILFAWTNCLYPMADISFIVVDLKYNREQGVKICEIQPGSYSRFSGSELLEGEGAIPDRYCHFLKRYYSKGYFTHPLYKNMHNAFVAHGWSSIHLEGGIAAKIREKPIGDPDRLSDYQTCFFSLSPQPILQKEHKRFPQMLFLDRAILPYSQNKYAMNCLLDQINEAKKLRPIWKVYLKGASEALATQIAADIPGDIVVIKPIRSMMGRGVIILEKKDLLSTLKYIFCSPKQVLLDDMERSYSQYAIDRSNAFIVEEFIPSDPLLLGPELLPYDCTMRLMLILSYDQKVASITYLGSYWYSPHKPLDQSYTLIQSHKAKGTHFSKVAPEIFDEVKRQLYPALSKTYLYMLNRNL